MDARRRRPWAAVTVRALQSKASRFASRWWREPNRALRRRVRHLWDEWRIRRSGLFDAEWYARAHPQVSATGMDPLTHFVRRGAAEGADPNPWFETTWYVERNPRAARKGRNPLAHYLRHPDRDPHPQFDTRAYLASNPDVALSKVNPLLHFLRKAAAPRGALATGVMNGAWYGATPIEHSWPGAPVAPVLESIAAGIDRDDTQALLRYLDPTGSGSAVGGAPTLLARSLAPLAHLERRMAEASPLGSVRGADGSTSFTVVTPFFRHYQHLGACARSILDLAVRSEGTPVEWILVNDDPDFTAADLERSVPASLRSATRIFSDGRRRGIVERLNEGIRAARHEWILFVDCDDRIEPEAVEVLRRYIVRFPRCRYVSSAMIDIDEEGHPLRHRRRTASPASLFADGMTAGHLKAVRRDAFDHHGLFDAAFEGCQDYEFALRVALEEPVLYVPEYLYSYRWHRASQSMAHAARQSRTADAIVRHYGLRLLAQGASVGREPLEPIPEHGVAVVRTQGLRNGLLAEALHSLRVQALPMTALVVVHGRDDAFASVREATAGSPGVELLHVPDTTRRRGHPLNVALRRILDSPHRFGFVCFLDDDDVLYPLFSSSMHGALVRTGADLVYAASNKRVPWNPAEAAYTPLPPPCLLVRNFIPVNSYAIRLEALHRAQLTFDDDLEYNEDWDFLVQAFGSGLRFRPIGDVLSEFRIIGDGNLAQEQKKDADLWEECLARIRPRQVRAARALGRHRLLEQMLEFPGHMLDGLDEDARKLVLSTRAFIDETCPATTEASAREVDS